MREEDTDRPSGRKKKWAGNFIPLFLQCYSNVIQFYTKNINTVKTEKSDIVIKLVDTTLVTRSKSLLQEMA